MSGYPDIYKYLGVRSSNDETTPKLAPDAHGRFSLKYTKSLTGFSSYSVYFIGNRLWGVSGHFGAVSNICIVSLIHLSLHKIYLEQAVMKTTEPVKQEKNWMN